MGFYPAPPGRRMPWDRDGSALVHVSNSAVITTRPLAERQAANDETNSDTTQFLNGGAKSGVVFPIPQTVVGVYVADVVNVTALNWVIEYSLDTTTLNDGTWTIMRAAGSFGQEVDVPATYRLIATGVSDAGIWVPASPIANVKGVRVRVISVTGSPRLCAMHIYGYPTVASNRLMLWHPTIDQGLAATPSIYDFGDVPRGTGYVNFSFRVKNISPTLTAQSVTLIREALSDGSPTIISLTDLRYNGGAWGSTASVGNVGPGAISALCEARINIDGTAPIGPWAPRIIAAAASWA